MSEIDDFKKCIKLLFKGKIPNRLDLLKMVFNYREKEIKTLKEVIDTKKALIDGMRRVLAAARMVNAQHPDIRLIGALEAYDKRKSQVNKLEKLL